jgi:hypothetical protein
MLLKQETLRGIANGSIALAFRRWRRPTVKAGGMLLTSIGQLAVEAVDIVSLEEITEAEATAAGFKDLNSLGSQLLKRAEGDVYRVRLSLAGPDPRIAMREEIPELAELESILQRLGRLDSRGASGPWTCRLLKLLRERPEERAANLARDVGMDKADFKAKVRKLKGLGLTESLTVGYRLSPRGEAVLGRLGDCRGGRISVGRDLTSDWC